MDRINGAGHSNHLFVAENAGANVPPTEITAEWLNAVQEEIVAVIASAGIALNPLANNQMASAIAALIATAMGSIGAATETASGKVELATNAETITGTDTVRATHPAGVKAAIQAAIAALVNAAPAALDTLNELATALGNDASFATTVTTALAAKAPATHVGSSGGAHANATAAVAGFMSSGDKSKLDGIAAGAQVNSVTSVNGLTGAVALQSAKASVNFNAENTVAIRSVYNVASITDNGVGQFYINFTSPLASVDYCPMISNSAQASNGYGGTYATLIFNSGASPNVAAPTTTGFGVLFTHNGTLDLDPTYACVAVF